MVSLLRNSFLHLPLQELRTCRARLCHALFTQRVAPLSSRARRCSRSTSQKEGRKKENCNHNSPVQRSLGSHHSAWVKSVRIACFITFSLTEKERKGLFISVKWHIRIFCLFIDPYWVFFFRSVRPEVRVLL